MGMFFFVLFILAGMVAMLAQSRGRSAVGFFLLSLVLSPIVGLAVVLIKSNRYDDEAKERERKQEHERQLESIRVIAKSNAAPAPAAPAVSVADEIRKLGDLKAQGLLTDEEFTTQKMALLKA